MLGLTLTIFTHWTQGGEFWHAWLLTLQSIVGTYSYAATCSWPKKLGIRAFFLWKTRPKQHSFQHTIMKLRALRLNPKYLINFSGADLMGRLKRIGSKTHARTASLRILQRYLLYQGRRWCARQKRGVWTMRTDRYRDIPIPCSIIAAAAAIVINIMPIFTSTPVPVLVHVLVVVPVPAITLLLILFLFCFSAILQLLWLSCL